jgi:flagellar M-ring protein FliF
LTALAPNGLTSGAGGLALADGTGGAALLQGGVYSGGIPAVSAPTGMAALTGPGHSSGGPSAAQLEDEAMISLSQIEGQMRASSLRKLTDIVGKHPDATLTIMRGWMAQENG